MVEGGDPASDPTGVVTRQWGGARQREGSPPHRAAPERQTHKNEMVRNRARGRADRTGERTPRGWCGAASLTD
jgi:hypothetical protein